MKNLFKKLNFKDVNLIQKKIILYNKNPLLIIAGAGSGKTRILVYKIIYLIINKKILLSNILAITFTNKAVFEIKNRIFFILKQQNKNFNINNNWILTFHSMCYRILKKYFYKLDYNKNFVIINDYDKYKILKLILLDLNFDFNKYNIKDVCKIISKIKNNFFNNFFKIKLNDKNFENLIYKCFILYQKDLKKNQKMDFDDLILNIINLFNNNPDILKKYQKQFLYIFIDEFQDVNCLQYILINMLSKINKKICVVGDFNQSIYSWRGANLENIINFEKDYKNVVKFFLKQNFRSTNNIIKVANCLIKNNYDKKIIDYKLWTKNKDGYKVFYYNAFDEKDEIQFIIKQIKKLIFYNRKYNDIAIFYRTNIQSKIIEKIFIKNLIPYKIIGEINFFDKKCIKNILSYLYFIYNINDFLNFERIMKFLKCGIGKVTIKKIKKIYDINFNISILEIIKKKINLNNFSKKILNILLKFSIEIENFIKLYKKLSLYEFVKKVLLNIGFYKNINLYNIKKFLNIVKEFEIKNINIKKNEILGTFLNELSLYYDFKNNNIINNEKKGFVSLMTIHSSKGLEFPIVFLIGMEDGIFPTFRSLTNKNKIKEERRLAYVAITRAKELLFLINSKKRFLYGKLCINNVSRFINEIDKKLLYIINNNKLNFFLNKKNNKNKFYIGDKIKHQYFGIGIIFNIKKNKNINDFELHIFFINIKCIKILLLSIAPIYKILKE